MKPIKTTEKIFKQIQDLFNEIETLYLEIPENIQDQISKTHSEDHSLPYCIRWGKQAIDEITEDGL